MVRRGVARPQTITARIDAREHTAALDPGAAMTQPNPRRWRVEVERAELFAGQPEQAVGWVLVNDAGEKYQEHAPAVWISLDRAAAEQKRDELNAAE